MKKTKNKINNNDETIEEHESLKKLVNKKYKKKKAN